MVSLFDLLKKHGKIIEAIKNERLTKQEIMNKNISGINKTTIAPLVKDAIEDGLLLADGDSYYLNTSILAPAFSDFAAELDILPSEAKPFPSPEEYGLPPLTPEEQKNIEELERDNDDLKEMNEAYESIVAQQKEELERLRAINEQLQAEKEEMANEAPKNDNESAGTPEGEEVSKLTSEKSPAFSPDTFLASINEKIDERMEEITKRLTEQMSEMSSTTLTAIATVTAAKSDTEAENKEVEAKVKEAEAKTKEQEQKIEEYKEEIETLNKKLVDMKNDTLSEVKKQWEEIKQSLYADPTKALPSGVVVAYDERTGGNVRREGKVETVPYFPGKPHACEANRPPLFYFPDNMTTDAMGNENIKKTAGVFSSMTKLYKQAAQSKDKEKTFSDGKEQLVMELLQDPELNDVQKISKYSVIRTLSGEYFNLLLAAVQNGLKASDIIAFLEAPPESFNIEIVRQYVSLAMNEKNSNLRLEVARDLIDRRWSINDGKDEYVLYPKSEIDALKALLDKAGNFAIQENSVQENPPEENPVQENDTQTGAEDDGIVFDTDTDED